MKTVKRQSTQRDLTRTARAARYRKRYERLKKEIRKVGFICQGSITERYLTCGKTACGCHQEPARRHGPYYHWTRKVRGRTQGRMLSPDIVPLYRQGIRNFRRLETILEKMMELSLAAFEAAKIDSKD